MKSILICLLALFWLSSPCFATNGDLSVAGNITGGGDLALTSGKITFKDGTTQNTAGSALNTSTNGYQILPNGLILVWGTTSSNTNLAPLGYAGCTAPVSVQFSQLQVPGWPAGQFPHGILSATISGNGSSIIWSISSKNQSGITAWASNLFGSWVAGTYSYFAIGY